MDMSRESLFSLAWMVTTNISVQGAPDMGGSGHLYPTLRLFAVIGLVFFLIDSNLGVS